MTILQESTPPHFLYASAPKIYPRTVHGFFANLRWVMVVLTQLVFYGLPWLEWAHRPAVLFNLEARRFYLFPLILYPQDFIYLTALLVICALSLFLFTALSGRVWCGFACPQTVYSEIFMWVERQVEGDRPQRIKLDHSDLNLEVFMKKTIKHLIWGLIALWTGLSFVGYFIPIRELLSHVWTAQLAGWSLFWVLFYAFATYGNAGFMREQVCKYMCPYARFQSAMFDADTLIVGYDAKRGEPRGHRSKSLSTEALQDDLGLGHCIDCQLCVQVCPTGIDIRKGLQYECIGCGACADVCNDVMKKMSYPIHLIQYASENAIENRWGLNEQIRRIFRTRVLIYASLLLSLCLIVAYQLSHRSTFRVDIVRDRSTMARIVEGQDHTMLLENIYRFQIMNSQESTQHFEVSAHGMDQLRIETPTRIEVPAAQSKWSVLRVSVPAGQDQVGAHPIWLDVKSLDDPRVVSEQTVFIVPTQ
jgi:cytochrome c oxidase accessory protein FixG